ncbi:MAG: division plane positioning ATPase MipZ [Alphaproteobacteria bacterium]
MVGNEKGGSGKSTTAVHLIVGALRRGLRVAALDLDARQGTLTRHLENRAATAARRSVALPMPSHDQVSASVARDRATAEAEEEVALAERLDRLLPLHDLLVIDTPGSDSHLSRLGHARADVLVTPINDSFVDLDLLARVDPETLRIVGPSRYSEMVWEQKMRRAARDRGSIDWIVMRNRLGHLDARNKREVARVLDELMRRLRCRLVPGFGERVIFRELFLRGLTLFDLEDVGMTLTMSHVAARQEVRALMAAVGLAPSPEPPAALSG